MVIFSLKLLNNLRKAIAGRRFPHQLAGGVALGVLLGVIPHGNLLALVVLMAVLCFRINHALLAVVAIAVSFGATRLDPYSHSVGEYLLSHPTGSSLATQAWALPVLPWTDLNNTVVLGSFVIGLASVLPIFYITLPFFRLIAPAETEEDAVGEKDTSAPADRDADDTSAGVALAGHDRTDEAHGLPQPRRLPAGSPVASAEATNKACADDSNLSEGKIKGETAEAAASSTTKHSVSLLVDPQAQVPPPRFALTQHSSETVAPIAPATIPIDGALSADQASPSDAIPTNEQMVSVETRIDVIRMRDYRDDETSADASIDAASKNETAQPMDEALNYLLRQLRHSQERKAAG